MIKPGVYREGKKYTAVISAPGARTCRLRLFEKGASEPCAYVEMQEDAGTYGLFSCTFTANAFSYDFETDDGTADAAIVLDPYATKITGREVFGVQDRTQMSDSVVAGTVLGVAGAEHSDKFLGAAGAEHSDQFFGAAGAEHSDKVFGAARAVLQTKAVTYKDTPHAFIDYSDLILYKLHVRGFTRDTSSGVKNPGTFKGIMQKMSYIKSLGVNGLLLMPCYDFDEIIADSFSSDFKLNYWGYGAKAQYFAPKASFASNPEAADEEFAELVYKAHANGMDVFMEMDFAQGTPDILMLEALRFWHDVYHIDGFRLISGNISSRLMATDPYLAGVKLIGRHWDEDCIKYSGRYSREKSAGNRPLIAECSENYMTTLRRYIKGDEGQLYDFTALLTAGNDKLAHVNYLTDHDSFTLADLYSYDVRHNESNGEKNADGREISYSWNCGVEGPTKKKNILQLRARMMRNAIAALLLSQGTPMIMAGDEFGCTHMGNNNPYCCDSPEGWVVWDKTAAAKDLKKFTAELIKYRRAHRVLSNVIELKGTDYIYSGCPDVSIHGTNAWYPDYSYYSRCVGVLFNGAYALVDRVNPDASIYIAFNMHHEDHKFGMPDIKNMTARLVMSTAPETTYDGGRFCELKARSVAVFEFTNDGKEA